MRALDSQFFKARCDNADYTDVKAEEPRLEYGVDILFQLSTRIQNEIARPVSKVTSKRDG